VRIPTTWSGAFDRAEDESALEIERSFLSFSGRSIAKGVLDAVRALGRTAELALQTDDDGLTLEFSDADHGRDLLFAIPQDGTRIYFIIREHDHVREAGLVVHEVGISGLAAWLFGNGDFPSEGVQLG
jgi:hypothetical protein